MINSYKDLIVWQKSIDLVVLVYKLTSALPKEELYGLSSQMKRSAISISSNIAEGRHRGSRKDFRQFLIISYGSSAELETQILIAKKLSLIKNNDTQELDSLLQEVMKMLNVMISKLSKPEAES